MAAFLPRFLTKLKDPYDRFAKDVVNVTSLVAEGEVDGYTNLQLGLIVLV